jgi:hypothetical protein
MIVAMMTVHMADMPMVSPMIVPIPIDMNPYGWA